MRGRQVKKRRARAGEAVRDEPVLVDAEALDPGACRGEGVGGALVAGVLDGADVCRRQEHARDQIDAFLHAADDDDAACVGDDAARCRDVARNGRAQPDQAGRLGILRQADGAAVGDGVIEKAPPGLQRKQSGARPAGKEVEREPAAMAADEIGCVRTVARRRHR